MQRVAEADPATRLRRPHPLFFLFPTHKGSPPAVVAWEGEETRERPKAHHPSSAHWPRRVAPIYGGREEKGKAHSSPSFLRPLAPPCRANLSVTCRPSRCLPSAAARPSPPHHSALRAIRHPHAEKGKGEGSGAVAVALATPASLRSAGLLCPPAALAFLEGRERIERGRVVKMTRGATWAPPFLLLCVTDMWAPRVLLLFNLIAT